MSFKKIRKNVYFRRIYINNRQSIDLEFKLYASYGRSSFTLYYYCNVLLIRNRCILYLQELLIFSKMMSKYKESMIMDEDLYFMELQVILYFFILALLSMNFLQYGIYHAICAWVLLIVSFVLHSMALMR